MWRFIFLLFILFSVHSHVLGQPEKDNNCYILFYNTENLFDTQDDPLTDDQEFLPRGDRHWTNYRFDQKLNHLSKVILSSAGFELPAIVGLCEVENRFVLERLLSKTPLEMANYSIIHKDSPDERGIDVGLLYRSDRATPLSYHFLPLVNNEGEIEETREILHAEFLLSKEDTIHVFFNHWPSRYGGQSETEKDRMLAATTLKMEIDKLQKSNPKVKVVTMGDFNDQPQNESLKNGLQAVETDQQDLDGELINLSAFWKQGTIKYRQTWSVFDQIIVTDQLLNPIGWHTNPENATIVNLPFLFEADEKFKGQKLNRTFSGFSYHGGFSDHLPILLKLVR